MRLRDGVEPWPHQWEMAGFIADHEKTLLLAGTGTGKTLASMLAAADLGYRSILVLTVKAAMRSVWEEDLQKFFEDLYVLTLDTGTSKKKKEALNLAWQLQEKPLVVVVNYETARLLDLGDYAWDYVVADESHKLKSHNSAQSVDLAVALQDVPHKVAMTGTGWDDRPTDVFGQVRFLEPVKKGRTWGTQRFGSWTAFFEEYVVYHTIDNIKIPKRYKKLDQMADKLAPDFMYVDRDAVRQTTGVQFITRHAYLSKAHRRFYDELEYEMVAELDGDEVSVDNPLVLDLRLHQVAGGFYKPDWTRDDVKEIPKGTAKLDALTGIVEELGDEPFVVFTRFTEDVTRIALALTKMGVSTKRLTGERDEHRQWQKGEGQALIANIAAGSAGVNLTRAAYAIYYSTGYSNTDYIQSLGRLDRPGQTRPVTIYNIVAKETVDQKIAQRLVQKSGYAEKLLEEMEKRT